MHPITSAKLTTSVADLSHVSIDDSMSTTHVDHSLYHDVLFIIIYIITNIKSIFTNIPLYTLETSNPINIPNIENSLVFNHRNPYCKRHKCCQLYIKSLCYHISCFILHISCSRSSCSLVFLVLIVLIMLIILFSPCHRIMHCTYHSLHTYTMRSAVYQPLICFIVHMFVTS